MLKTRQGGFNLVELAIVLVIIGLLLGGVLKGQALVTNAKIKRAENDIQGVTAAVYAYLDRYGALPGDDDKACARWGAACTGQPVNRDVPDGNGNGTLSGAWNALSKSAASVTNESYFLWLHLFKANLVGAETAPTNAFGGKLGIEEGSTVYNADGSGMVNTGLSGLLICMDAVSGDLAEIIDLNSDDGIPNDGLTRAFVENANGDMTALAAAYNAGSTYVICRRM